MELRCIQAKTQKICFGISLLFKHIQIYVYAYTHVCMYTFSKYNLLYIFHTFIRFPVEGLTSRQVKCRCREVSRKHLEFIFPLLSLHLLLLSQDFGVLLVFWPVLIFRLSRHLSNVIVVFFTWLNEGENMASLYQEWVFTAISINYLLSSLASSFIVIV